MSITALDPALASRIAALAPHAAVMTPEQKVRAAKLTGEWVAAAEASPLSAARRLPWQQVVYALALGLPWDSAWGPAPSRPPELIAVIAANQIGKSTIGGMVGAAHLTGLSARFPTPGHVWFGMPRLEDSVEVQRAKVEPWIPKRDARWLPRFAGGPTTTLVDTRQGGHGRFKAYEQGLDAWESQSVQAVIFDEPPSDELIAASRTRTMRENGFTLAIFTPLKDEHRNPDFRGTDSQLYRDTWEPWQDYKSRHPHARWGEVTPGVWVFALSVFENSDAHGGFLPHARIESDRAKLIAEGKPLEAAVRYDGEWIDISADSLVPHESVQFWSAEPHGGFARVHCRIDPAYSAKTANCESAIAVWAADRAGKLYQLESRHGHWNSDERLRNCADLLVAYGCPDTTVQRVPGDVVFGDELNRELMRRGQRACVRPHPETGPVPDKVTRAQQFAPMCANGQIFVRPEHVEFMAQLRRLSAAFIRKGGLVDVADAGIGAALMLVASPVSAFLETAIAGSGFGKQRDDAVPEWAWSGGRDLLDEVD